MFENLQNINPNLMPDEQSKKTVALLLNVIEQMQKIITEQSKEIQLLKDEINHLKGEQGKPKFNPKKEPKDISSSKHINKPKAHNKTSKKSIIKVDKKVKVEIDKSKLPPDSVFKGYKTVIQQDIVFKTNNIEFELEIWYSPSKNKTFRAKHPDYNGYFGNNLKAYILTMHHYADMTHSKLLGLLTGMGIEISAGTIQNILNEDKQKWIKEKQDILKSGMQDSFTQTDTTGAKVAGESWHTHILCSDNFVVFSTLPGKSRRSLLYALQGEPESGLMFAYNDVTEEYLNHFKISQRFKKELKRIYNGAEAINETEFKKKTLNLIPDLEKHPTIFNWICDAFAFGFYHSQESYMPVNILISDDAPEYKLIADYHSLCWVHDARYYNKLAPVLDYHKQITKDFKEKYWLFYDTLSDYKKNPNENLKQKILADFDKLFISNTDYFDLNREIERTKKNKDKLLEVLAHPQIPLHNNLSELEARAQVRKRDICLHTMTRSGTQLQDAFMSIINTCKLAKKNAFAYIANRISGNINFYLPDIVLQNIRASIP